MLGSTFQGTISSSYSIWLQSRMASSKTNLLPYLLEKMERPSILLTLQKSQSASYSNTPYGIPSGACWYPLMQSHGKQVEDGSFPTLIQMPPPVKGIECTMVIGQGRVLPTPSK